MAPSRKPEAANRERLLDSAARLLEANGVDVSTRAICEDAGVTAPTLYHYFGDREGLLQEVVTRAFGGYLDAKKARESTGDPVGDLLAGWDDHNDWGTSHPSFYALMYGQVTPGRRAPATDESEGLLLQKLQAAARAGRLRVPPETAARIVTSANVGSTLYLISRPEAAADDLSRRVRDATFASILTPEAARLSGVDGEPGPGPAAVAAAAIALRAALADSSSTGLAGPELSLLDSWLDRLSVPNR